MNIFKRKQNCSYDFLGNNIKSNYIDNLDNYKHNQSKQGQIIYSSPSTEEWSNSIYTYDKSYIKLLVNIDKIIDNLIKSYFNMIEEKIKIYFKNKRVRKDRFLSNRIYVSKAKTKHTNDKVIITLYIYNKQKYIIQRKIKNIIKYIYSVPNYFFKLPKKGKISKKSILFYIWKKRFEKVILKETFKIVKKNKNIILLTLILSKFDTHFSKKFIKNVLLNKKLFFIERSLLPNIKSSNLYKNIINYMIIGKNFGLIEEKFTNIIKELNFNKCKFTNLFTSFRSFGIISLIKKIYNKKVELKIIELKSIHLNSDIFSSAIAIKLRNRKNRALKVLIKAVRKIKLPALYLLLTSDNNSNNINKDKILNFIQQKVVSGVRFETSGRLTRRLTASRSVFKVRYNGSLKNIRSSYNNLSSVVLRGHVKSNLQYTIINSKTRNGSFGLKGWISSH